MLKILQVARRWPAWLRAGLSTAAIAIALAAQLPIEKEVPGEPFLLFFIVVIASTLAFGERIGILAVVLTTLLSTLFFEPVGSLTLQLATDLIKVELYAIIAGASIVAVSSLGKILIAAETATQELRQTDTKRTILLQELAHRVANNFAVVAALIQTKAAHVSDPKAKSALNEAIDQVAIMARVHKRLQNSDSVVSLDSERFVTELCSDLQISMARGRAISIECHAVSVPLSTSQSVPLGLILNELVTNALKHAFPDGRPGTVQVILTKGSCNTLTLAVEDDGVGQGFDVRPESLGKGLVSALAEQLGGRFVSMSSRAGTSSSVTFPYDDPRLPHASEHSHAVAP
jgi:two-component sensor histidine kinase